MKENIPSLPCHFVSEQGQVFRKDEYIDGRSGKIFQKRKGSWKKLHISIHTNRKGKYQCPKVHVCVKGITRSLKVSRLVAEAYIPNPLNKPCVCHKDNNPLNNHYKNLYWGTHQENMAQMIVDGRKQKGEECPRWVNKEIPELFDYYCDGVSTMELAEMFNTNKSMINKIIRYKFKELWQGRK